METNSRDNGEGTMEAVYFGNCTIWGKGAGNGPWVMGDLENGLWAGNVKPLQRQQPITTCKYVTGMVKGDAAGKNHWTIKEGNAQSGTLTTPFDGQRPSSRYNPMRKEGAIGLGTGGDNSNAAQGNFFEGVMTPTTRRMRPTTPYRPTSFLSTGKRSNASRARAARPLLGG